MSNQNENEKDLLNNLNIDEKEDSIDNNDLISNINLPEKDSIDLKIWFCYIWT